MKVKKIQRLDKSKQAQQMSIAQFELHERANNHILQFTKLMFPKKEGRDQLNITDIPLPDVLRAIIELGNFCTASFEIRHSEFLDEWVFATAVLDKILVALNALASCIDRAKEIPPGHEELIIDCFAANLEKIFPKVYELCLERIKAGNFSGIGEKIKDKLNKARFKELCSKARTSIENIKNLRGQTSAILQIFRWPGPDPYMKAGTPNWDKFNLEKISALVWAIVNLLETSDIEAPIRSEVEDFIFDQSLFWLGGVEVEHKVYLAELLPKSSVFMRMAEEDEEFKKGPENQTQIRERLSAKSKCFGEGLFLTLQPELMSLLAAEQFGNLELISEVFSGALVRQFIFDHQTRLKRIADENAAILSAEEERRDFEKFARYQQLTKRKNPQIKGNKSEVFEDAPKESGEAIEPVHIELSLHRQRLRNLMLDTGISLPNKISEVKRFLQAQDLSDQDFSELYTALGQLILKQKDPKPEELNELIENLKPFLENEDAEQNDWIRDLISELDEKYQVLMAARARVKSQIKTGKPEKTAVLLLPKNVPEVLEILDTFWGKAYVIGGYPRNFFAKNMEETDVDIVVIGCPGDFFRREDYRSSLSEQLKRKIKKEVTVRTTSLPRLLILEVDGQSYDIWFSVERSLDRELKRRDLTFNTICVDKNGRPYSFPEGSIFKDSIKHAQEWQCKPVDGWKEFFADPIRLLRLLKMVELRGFKLDAQDKRVLDAELKQIRKLDKVGILNWLSEEERHFTICLTALFLGAVKKDNKKAGSRCVFKLLLSLGIELLQHLGVVDQLLHYSAFAEAYGRLYKKPGPGLFQAALPLEPGVAEKAPAMSAGL